MAEFVAFERPGVSGFLHRPEGDGECGLVLTHGAGGDCRAPLLIAAAEAFAARGIAVLRCDLPFRQRRRKGPPSPAHAAADRDGLRLAIAALRMIVPGQIFLGGQSYGGRQASLLAADMPELAAGLVLFSYPLHPPGKPERLRSEHFPRLRVPIVFVQGTADPFGSIAELEAATALIPAATRLIPVTGAGHDLKRGRFDLDQIVARFFDGRAPPPRHAR
ncbi:MAG TPA: alpha/beta family hydrolase [Stellaceae bacterium]|nr:alpha/beta family hydrolase [Stellaceae bacterium]